MKKNTAVWIVVIIVVLAIIAIVVSMHKAPSSTPVPATSSQPVSSASSGLNQAIVLNTATNATLGTFLTASNGMTLYTSAQDTSGVSNCTGGCATAWPPYTTTSTGILVGGAGATGTVSTITRADGTMQITYNGMPLYFWQGDKVSGDATGQNVNGFTVAKS